MIGELLTPLINFTLKLISGAGYPGIVAAMALENIFPPIPSEVVMPFAGFLITQGRFSIIPAIASGVAGSVLGAIALYGLGATLRGKRFRSLIENYGKYAMVSTDDLDAAERFFNRYGDWAVLIARVVPLVRSIISVPAGFTKMGGTKFIGLTILGTAVWTTALTYSGIILGENWNRVGPILKRYEDAVLIILIILGTYYLFRKKKTQKVPSELKKL